MSSCSYLGEVAVVVKLIANLTGVMNESKGAVCIVENPAEAGLGGVDHAGGLNHLEDVTILK